VQDYGHALQHDEAYAAKANHISEIACDISDVIALETTALKQLITKHSTLNAKPIAFHAPCTLQHGLKKKGVVEGLLTDLGFELTPVADAHLCCGSAGTYSILQPELAQRLRANKITALESGMPHEIVTANIGCQSHLQAATKRPVRHWIELLHDRLP
jgi:glycolate oxidase iron-sulfur subunit